MESDSAEISIYDDNDEFLIQDETLKRFKDIAKTKDIKKLRMFINIHNDKLKNTKTKILNDLINVPGYKISKRFDKVFLVKISPSELRKMNDLQGTSSEAFHEAYDEGGFSKGQPKKGSFQYIPNNETYNDFASDEEFQEIHTHEPSTYSTVTKPQVTNPQRHFMNPPATNPQDSSNPSATKPQVTNPQDSSNPSATNPCASPQTEDTVQNPAAYVNNGTQGIDSSLGFQVIDTTNGLQANDSKRPAQINQFSNNTQMANLMNRPRFKPLISFNEYISRQQQNETPEQPKQIEAIYELLKQQNDIRDNQQKQYEQITKALSDSIDAKNNKELELSNRMKSCVETIEKTFSNGTFDRIVQGISEMVKTITENQNKELGEVKQTILNCQTEVDNLRDITNKIQTEKANKENIDDDLMDRIDFLEDSVHETTEKMEAFHDFEGILHNTRSTIEGIMKKIDQQDILIGKLCLAVYNIDESLINKIFSEEEIEKISTIQTHTQHPGLA